jgi:hypothetical protein
MDDYSIPLQRSQDSYLERQFIELLLEESPDIRGGTFSTLEEAIAAHDREFRNPLEP